MQQMELILARLVLANLSSALPRPLLGSFLLTCGLISLSPSPYIQYGTLRITNFIASFMIANLLPRSGRLMQLRKLRLRAKRLSVMHCLLKRRRACLVGRHRRTARRLRRRHEVWTFHSSMTMLPCPHSMLPVLRMPSRLWVSQARVLRSRLTDTLKDAMRPTENGSNAVRRS